MMPERLSTQTIYESDWISLYADKVKMPEGYIIDTYHRLHYPHESVCVVIYNDQDEILMIQSKRYITGRLEWEIPAGRVEDGESPVDAAKRECLEETGCILEKPVYLCSQYPNNGMSDLRIHIFAARVQAEESAWDENEVNCKKWVKRHDMMDMMKNGEITCGVSMLSLLYAEFFYRQDQ